MRHAEAVAPAQKPIQRIEDMFMQIVSAALAQASLFTTGIPSADLAVECSGTALVSATADPHYSPAIIHNPPTRAPDLPASISFKAVLAVQSVTPGCAVLADKYGIDLDGASLLVDVSAAEFSAFSLKLAEEAADAAVGQQASFKVSQHFTYALGGYLPLFSVAHEESLSIGAPLTIKTVAGTVTMHVGKAYEVDEASVYGVKPPAQMSDVEKVAAAQLIAGTIVTTQAGSGWGLGHAYDSLLFNDLEPRTIAAKAAYKDSLVGVLDQLAALTYPPALFFDFGVGGSGGYPLAGELNKLSAIEGVFAPAETTALLFKYPTLGLAGFGADNCLNVAPQGLETVLKQALATETLTSLQKHGFKSMVGYIGGGYLNITGCFPEAKTPAIKALAASLGDKLAAP